MEMTSSRIHVSLLSVRKKRSERLVERNVRKKWMMLILATMLLLTACSENGNSGKNDGGQSGNGNAASTLEKAKEQGYITIGFAGENPYAYKDENGELTGEAVEIARTILKRLGIEEMRAELTEFSGLIAGLQAKRFDMIAAGMFINPERCEAVLFANPEYSIGEGLAVKAGNPLNLTSYKAIAENKDAKVAVMSGAVEIGYLEASGVTEAQMVIVPDQDAAISALQSGRADAMTMTGPALQSRLDQAGDEGLERVMDFEQPTVDGNSVRGYGASAFRLDDVSLQEAFNTELDAMKESGELLQILQQFGFTEQELPGDVTAPQLCSPQA